MNVHVKHPHTEAAIKAHKLQCIIGDRVEKLRDLNRAILQLGSFEDVVDDGRDRCMFLTLTGLVDEALTELENSRKEISEACHAARYGDAHREQEVV